MGITYIILREDWRQILHCCCVQLKRIMRMITHSLTLKMDTSKFTVLDMIQIAGPKQFLTNA